MLFAPGGRRAGTGGVWRVEVGALWRCRAHGCGNGWGPSFEARSPGPTDRRHLLIDSLIARGLDPAVPRLFIIDGSKALSRAIRRSFGHETAIQRCQIHKARNIMARLPKGLHVSVRRALRQAWELDDAAKAERLIRNLAQRLEHEAPGVSGSLLEGLDEILTVTRLGLPAELRRSLACTNIIENMMGTIRRVSRNVKHWRSASMALRWTAAAMLEAKKGFRRLKAYKQLPALRAALIARSEKTHPRNLDKLLKVA